MLFYFRGSLWFMFLALHFFWIFALWTADVNKKKGAQGCVSSKQPQRCCPQESVFPPRLQRDAGSLPTPAAWRFHCWAAELNFPSMCSTGWFNPFNKTTQLVGVGTCRCIQAGDCNRLHYAGSSSRAMSLDGMLGATESGTGSATGLGPGTPGSLWER